jgi:hypothetical protein
MEKIRYPCSCGNTFSTKNNLRIHQLNTCKLSDQSSRRSKRELSQYQHRKTKNDIPINKLKYFCDCGYAFSELNSFAEHKKFECKPIVGGAKCSCVCGMKFTTEIGLYVHRQFACDPTGGETRYSCDCEMTFTTQVDLQVHQQFVCELFKKSLPVMMMF